MIITDQLSKKDYKNLKKLYKELFAIIYPNDNYHYTMSKTLRNIREKNIYNDNNVFIVKNADEIVGFSHVIIDDNNEATILYSYIKEEYRNKIVSINNQRSTVMLSLMQADLAWAKKFNATHITTICKKIDNYNIKMASKRFNKVEEDDDYIIFSKELDYEQGPSFK